MPEITTRYGELRVPDGDDDIIGRFLARYGEWAWLESIFVAETLESGSRVLDAGAFVGTFGLGLTQLQDIQFLCCIEGNKAIAPLLADNVGRLACCPISVINAVLCTPGSSVRKGESQAGNLGSLSFVPTAQYDAAPLPTISLNTLRQQHGDFDLIKLDVEGMEYDILQGDAAALATGQTTLWIECNETTASLKVAGLVLSWGLPVHYFAFPSHNPKNFNGASDAIFPWAFEAGLLVAPRKAPVLTAALREAGCLLAQLSDEASLRDAMWRTPRWGRPEWEHASTPQELAALIGHALRGESMSTFLQFDQTPGQVPPTLWDQVDRSQAAQAEARSLLDAERNRVAALDAALEEARDLAFTRLDELAMERDRREAAEQGLCQAKSIVADQQSGIAQLEVELARTAARALAHLAAIGQIEDGTKAVEERLQATIQAEARRGRQAVAAAITEGDARVAAARAEMEALARRAAKAELLFLSVQKSTFWRATWPLRACVNALRANQASGSVRKDSLT